MPTPKHNYSNNLHEQREILPIVRNLIHGCLVRRKSPRFYRFGGSELRPHQKIRLI